MADAKKGNRKWLTLAVALAPAVVTVAERAGLLSPVAARLLGAALGALAPHDLGVPHVS